MILVAVFEGDDLVGRGNKVEEGLMVDWEDVADLGCFVVGAGVLLDDFLIDDVVDGHVATLLGEEDVFAEYCEMLDSLSDVHSAWQEEALCIVPFQIVAFVIIC